MLNFNGVEIPPFVKVKKIDIQTIADVTSNVKSIAGSFGCVAGQSTFGSKLITADISIVIPEGESLQSCSRVLAKWLKGNNFKPSKLIIADDSTIQYTAKVSNSVNLSDLLFVGEGSIEFLIPSGLSETIKPVTYSGNGAVTFSSGGSHTALPEITATLTQDYEGTVLITQVNTGDKVILNGTFKTGDVVNINCSKHLVKVNGDVSMSIVGLNTKFFELEEGEHQIKCSVGATLKVIFQERWI